MTGDESAREIRITIIMIKTIMKTMLHEVCRGKKEGKKYRETFDLHILY